MRLGNQKGFTIIEVVLFLALSALFMVIAFAGVRGRTASVQFTDSIRSLQSYLVSEQNKVLNGVNSTSNSPCNSIYTTGTNKSCLLLGRVVSFGQNASDLTEVSATSLYGTNNLLDDSLSDLELIRNATPKPDGVVSKYEISWDTKFSTTKPDSAQIYNRVGWLRSPKSSNIIPILFRSDAPAIDGAEAQENYNYDDDRTLIGDEILDVKMCFVSPDNRYASILFGDTAGRKSFDIVFEDADCTP